MTLAQVAQGGPAHAGPPPDLHKHRPDPGLGHLRWPNAGKTAGQRGWPTGPPKGVGASGPPPCGPGPTTTT